MFPDQKVEDNSLRRFITDQVDKALAGAFELFDFGTLSIKDSSAEERYFEVFNEHVEQTIGKLCRLSIPLLNVDFSEVDSTPNAIESKKLSLVWETLRHKVEARIEALVDNYLQRANESSEGYLYLVKSWRYTLANCRNFVTRLLPSLQYITVNYPSVSKEVTRKIEVFDYFMIYFVNLLKAKLAADFEPFLEAFLSEQRSHNPLDKAYLSCETPLTMMVRYKIPLDQNSNSNVGSFFLRNVEAYARESLNLPINLNYYENLTKILVRNAMISGSISASLVAHSNDILIRHTIMDKDTTFSLLELLRDNARIKSTDTVVHQLFATMLMAYESRSMIGDLWSIYKAVISSTLKGVEGASSNERQLIDACKLLLVANQSEYMEKLAHKEVTKCLKGTIYIMERYLKVCESTIKKFNQVNIDGDMTVANYYESLALNLPVIMKMPSSFITIYCRSLFRRCIIHGLPVIETLTSPGCFENHLIRLFQKEYGSSPEYDSLETLKAELIRSAQIARNFSETQAANVLIPLVFERKSVPSVTHEKLADDIVLPKELQRHWTMFERFFEVSDTKARYKRLHLIDCLQHCEIQTQFKLSNGDALVLDLTLYQTCVITLFNDCDALTLAEMFIRSSIPLDLLNEVVESFMRVGFFTSQNDLILLNDNFIPDEKKIRNGKFRVPMSTIRGKSSKEGSAEVMQHVEGHSSHWKQEIIKACIVRSLKGEQLGLKFDLIYGKVESQLFGISMGEFKDALEKTVLENSITHSKGLYKY